MDAIKKKSILGLCNELEIDDLKAILNSGHITLEEFIDAGLLPDTIQVLQGIKKEENDVKKQRNAKDALTEREKYLQKIASGELSVASFVDDVNNGSISEKELLEMGLSQQTIESIKYFGLGRPPTIFKNIEDLPQMQNNRTDVYFIGISGTGKSTMLASLLYTANKEGILLHDSYNQEGSLYKDQIIIDLRRGVLPEGTVEGSFNYIAMSLEDKNKKGHPFNVVEVPGELYKNIYINNTEGKSDVEGLINYMKSDNKKILIFTIDAESHDKYAGPYDQSLVYVNIFDIFKRYGVLNETDAIYIMVNKFDTLREGRYKNDSRSEIDLSLDYMEQGFKSFLNTMIRTRSEQKNQFKIRVMPFSIGSVSHKFILNRHDQQYADNLIEILLEDSFILTKKGFGIFSS